MRASSSSLAESHSISSGDPAVQDLPVGRLDEAQLVDAAESGERGDQPDIRTFGRLDRAHASVVRVVDVAHLEARSLPRKPTRPQSREPALVGQLGQGIGLVHVLAELARPEERLDHGRHGARVHQVVDVDLLRVGVDRHPLLDQSGHAREADRELVRNQLTDRAHAAVAQVVDVVGEPASLGQVDQVAQDRNEVLAREDGDVFGGLESQPLIDLVPPHPAEVVTLRIEEHPLEGRASRLDIGSFTGAQQRIDGVEGLLLALRGILAQCVLDDRASGREPPVCRRGRP